MFEAPIARKCAGLLAGAVLFAGVSVWLSRPAPAPVPVVDAKAPAPVRASGAARPAAPAMPLAFRPAPPAPAPAGPSAPEPEMAARRVFQLELENARLRSRLDDMLNWILDNVRGTFPLPENQMANLRVAPVDTNLAVSADLAQLLRLNESEIERLDTAFLDTRTVLQEIGAENIAVEQPATNQLVLTIPPYAEAGQVVREELYGELRSTLGPARFDRFLQVSELALDENFDYFGQADRTVEFEALEDTATGDSQLFVRDERVLPSKDDPLRQDIIAFERIVTELPEEYYAYWNWLPEYVTRFARSN